DLERELDYLSEEVIGTAAAASGYLPRDGDSLASLEAELPRSRVALEAAIDGLEAVGVRIGHRVLGEAHASLGVFGKIKLLLVVAAGIEGDGGAVRVEVRGHDRAVANDDSVTAERPDGQGAARGLRNRRGRLDDLRAGFDH